MVDTSRGDFAACDTRWRSAEGSCPTQIHVTHVASPVAGLPRFCFSSPSLLRRQQGALRTEPCSPAAAVLLCCQKAAPRASGSREPAWPGCTGLGWRGLQLWGEGAVLPRKVGEELSDWRRGASGALWAQPSMGGSVGVNAGNSCDLVVGPGSLWGMEEQGNRRPDSVLLGIVGESL